MQFKLTPVKHTPDEWRKIDAIYIPTILSKCIGFDGFYQDLQKFARNVIVIGNSNSAITLPDSVLSLLGSADEFAQGFETFHHDLIGMKSSNNPSLVHSVSYDLPAKRNFALCHARKNGFTEVMLLDDDIYIEERMFRKAVYLLSEGFSMVGFYVLDFPDISTIDHINRITTEKKTGVSVAANCILIKVPDVRGFFPYVYNEDWHFIYVSNFHVRKAAAGTAYQLPHRPWLQRGRVAFEQFGDVLAAGIKRNLISSREPLEGERHFWSLIRDEYSQLLDSLLSHSSISRTHLKAVVEAKAALDLFGVDDLLKFIQSYVKEIEGV
ncbi:hypothetical protein TH47_17960 [Thalassospira sp. MCCC 1A02803]|nr:hypothetical protein AUQ41_09740 [Thalassospira sp. MCCC 1A02898]ONH86105.1 hypothetical protein TH47_17960 [Thalassospira sp. MCCC 1A02803]